MRPLRTSLYVLFLVGLAALPLSVIFLALRDDGGASAEPPPRLLGRVLALDGSAIPGATVELGGRTVQSDEQGRFEVPADDPQPVLVSAEHEDYLPRLKVAIPDDPVLLRLTPAADTVSLRFTGDVMFGRRFFDPNEDGDPSDALLDPSAGVPDHAALLSHVEPLLEAADLSIVNLETPLVRDPYIEPGEGRRGFHPTKEFLLASAPASAGALRRVGVDVVNIGNNHLYDALDRGVNRTIEYLERAGYQQGRSLFGGADEPSEALQPAITSAGQQRVAFLGCTSITEPIEDGKALGDHVTYVAEPGKGGAAACDARAVGARVRRLVDRGLVVVVQIHGGFEYERTPSPSVSEVTRAARRAGATMVVNHHPHVVGGLVHENGSVVAWTLGNFLFDQTVWPTFQSYVLTIDVKEGHIVRAYVDPLMIEDYTPRPLGGYTADIVTRLAAGLSPDGYVIEDGSLEFAPGVAQEESDAEIDLGGGADGIWRLPQGWRGTATGELELGRDLLWVGTFEDEEADADPDGGALWSLDSMDVSVEEDAARQGNLGARLRRTYANCSDVFLAPIHRLLVDGGDRLTISGWTRPSQANLRQKLQVSWYPDTEGGSRTWTLVELPEGTPGRWTSFRVDVTVPDFAVAMLPYVRMAPPADGEAFLDVDDVAVIEWSPDEGDSDGLGYVKADAPARLRLSRSGLPGTEAGVPGTLEPVGPATPLEASTDLRPRSTGC